MVPISARTERIGVRRLGDLSLVEAAYAPGAELPEHAHDRPSITVFLGGGLRETVGGRDFEGAPFDVVYKPPGVVHANRFGPGGARTLNLSWAETEGTRVDRYEWIRGGPRAELALRLVRELRLRDQAAELSLQCLSLELRDRDSLPQSGSDRGKKPPRWLKRVDELLMERFFEPLQLSDLASEVALHPIYVARVFRRYFGCSVGDYVRSLRLRWAAEQLSSSSASLASIALDAGFSDQAHFSRIFKRSVGTTPSRFRRLTSS